MPYLLIILSQQPLLCSPHYPFFCFSLFYHSFRLSRITPVFTCFAFRLKAYLPAIQQFCLHVPFFLVAQFKSFSYLSFFPSISVPVVYNLFFSHFNSCVSCIPCTVAPLSFCVSCYFMVSKMWNFFPVYVSVFLLSLPLHLSMKAAESHKKSGVWLLYLYSDDTAEAYTPYTGRKYF